jgi:hypothetical protein
MKTNLVIPTFQFVILVQMVMQCFIFLAVPSAAIRQESVAVQLGRTAKLHCQVTGSPQPRITWEKDSGKLPEQITIEEGILT